VWDDRAEWGKVMAERVRRRPVPSVADAAAVKEDRRRLDVQVRSSI
jgi:hypothetical protein